MKIVISIVSHSQSKLVKRLLSSLDKYVYSDMHEVIVNITENIQAHCEYTSKFPVVITRNLRGKGFGANHNAVFEFLEPDVFLIVNPDIEFIERLDLDATVSQMNASQIDITSPIIIDENGMLEDYKRSDLTIKNLLKRRIFKITDTKFDWYAGMFLIVNKSVFRTLGGFDTRFFMYVEDCDFCTRAFQNGFTLKDIANWSVKHSARRESRKIFSKHLLWHLQSLIKYWLKKIVG